MSYPSCHQGLADSTVTLVQSTGKGEPPGKRTSTSHKLQGDLRELADFTDPISANMMAQPSQPCAAQPASLMSGVKTPELLRTICTRESYFKVWLPQEAMLVSVMTCIATSHA